MSKIGKKIFWWALTGVVVVALLGIAVGRYNGSISSTSKPVVATSLIQAGTVISLIIVHGVEAPTNSDAQRNPLPILAKVTGSEGALPVTAKCFVTGEGYGNLSTERVVARGRTMACTGTNGVAEEAQIEGYLADTDGVVGIHGKVVTTSANELLSAARIPKEQIDESTAPMDPVVSIAGSQKAVLIITKAITPSDWVKPNVAGVSASFQAGSR